MFTLSCRPDPYTGKVTGKVHHKADNTGPAEFTSEEEYLIYMDNGWIYETDYLHYGMLHNGDSIKIGWNELTILKFNKCQR
jgi:hypothetical protein